MGKSLRWFGVVALVAGALQIAAPLGRIMAMGMVSKYIDLLGTVLALLALTGFYFTQVERNGWFIKLAFTVALLGTAMVTGTKWVHTFVEPWLMEAVPQLMAGPEGP